MDALGVRICLHTGATGVHCPPQEISSPALFCRLLNPGHGGYLSVESFPLLWKSAVADADRSGLMALPCSRSAEEDIAELTELAGALL